MGLPAVHENAGDEASNRGRDSRRSGMVAKNEFTKAMALRKIKASQSFVDVFVITPLEILENVVKFNWSKIAKGPLQLRKRKVHLMELK